MSELTCLFTAKHREDPLENREQILSFIKFIPDQKNVVPVHSCLRVLTGHNTLAMMLNQLIYWSARTTRADGFIYKSLSDWKKEIGATDYQVRKFKKLPYIQTKILRANNVPVTHYKIDKELFLLALMSKFPSVDFSGSSVDFDGSSVDFNVSLTYITTDTTTDNTTKELKDLQDFSACAESPVFPDSKSKPFDPFGENEAPSIPNITTVPPIIPHEAAEPIQNLKPKSTRSKSKSAYPNHHSFMAALAGITGFDISIKSNTGRLGRATKQLLDADYTVDDLDEFIRFWKAQDWRYQKNKQLPTPENVLSMISQSKLVDQAQIAPVRDYSTWLT